MSDFVCSLCGIVPAARRDGVIAKRFVVIVGQAYLQSMKLSGRARRRIVSQGVTPPNAIQYLRKCFTYRSAAALRDFAAGLAGYMRNINSLKLRAGNEKGQCKTERLPYLNAVNVGFKFQSSIYDFLIIAPVRHG